MVSRLVDGDNRNFYTCLYCALYCDLSISPFLMVICLIYGESLYLYVEVGNDQEMAQSEKKPTPFSEGWEKTKMTLRYLYQQNI